MRLPTPSASGERVTTWAVVAGLGIFHGFNPAMGWLFATAIGFQEGRGAAVLRALPPLAAGHALSVAVVVAAAGGARVIVPTSILRVAGALLLLAFASFLLVRRMHRPRGMGMRATPRELALWSFVMSTAHGSGLMLLPLLLAADSGRGNPGLHTRHHITDAGAGDGLLMLAVHSAAMLAALGAAALLAYYVVGVGFLRRAWINLDVLWIGALVLAAVATLVPG